MSSHTQGEGKKFDEVLKRFNSEFGIHIPDSELQFVHAFLEEELSQATEKAVLDERKRICEEIEKLRLPVRIKGRSILPDKKYMKALETALDIINNQNQHDQNKNP